MSAAHTEPPLDGMPAPVTATPEDTPPKPGRKPRTRTRSRAGGVDKAPRTRAPRPPRPSAAQSRAKIAATYAGKLAPLYALGGMFAGMRDEQIGAIVTDNATMLAQSWGPLAAENEAVRALIDRLTESSALLAVVLAHASVAAAILAVKGKLPEQAAMLPLLLQAAAGDGAKSSGGAGAAESPATPDPLRVV